MSQSNLQFDHRLKRSTWRWAVLLRTVALTVVILTVFSFAFAAKPKAEAKAAAKAEAANIEAAKVKAAASSTDLPGPPLPADLNLASLRVKALDVLYELDLSTDQLKELRTAAGGAGSTQQRTPAKGTEKLVATLREFQAALLDRTDDNQIDSLRNKMVDLADDDNVQLDDSVQITAAARTKTANVFKQFTASQIAAFLAAHADEVGDPVEMMMDTIEQVRELRASLATETEGGPDKRAAGDKAADLPGEVTSLVQDTSTDVGELVAGLDEAKEKSLTTEVVKWINSNSSMKDDDFAAQRKTLEEAARKMVGNIHPMRVLNNWLEHQVASLLSNPQLPAAIDAILQTKQTAK